jgi:hypothetical protein
VDRLFLCQGEIKRWEGYPALRYGPRSRKKELVCTFDFALDLPFAATWLPMVKPALAKTVPSDDPFQVFGVDAALFARAASIDLAIAASMGRTYSATALLFFMAITPCLLFVGLILSTAKEADFCRNMKKITSNNTL